MLLLTGDRVYYAGKKDITFKEVNNGLITLYIYVIEIALVVIFSRFLVVQLYSGSM